MAIPIPYGADWDKAMSETIRRRKIVCWWKETLNGCRGPRRRHEGIGILYCEQGEGIFSLGQANLPFHSGALIMFDSRLPHQVTMQSTYHRWDVCFMPEIVESDSGMWLSQFVTTRQAYARYHIPKEQEGRIRRIFHEIGLEADRPDQLDRTPMGLSRQSLFLLAQLSGVLEEFLVDAEVVPTIGRLFRPTDPSIQAILTYIDEHIYHDFTVAELARHVNYSTAQLWRLLRTTTGMSPSRYIRSRKVAHAANLLVNTDWPISEVALTVGIANQAYFSRLFREHMGCTPRQYRAYQLDE